MDRFVTFQRMSAIQKRVQENSSVFLNPYILFYISTIFKAVDIIDKTGLSVSLYMYVFSAVLEALRNPIVG